ncbi:molybdate ABC transporter substrate-binding protein [uncultured Methanobrevibacter sp.]|uniref:molybdate ABC transporter substrate-binding protein n=1 Tax=uncultured Methanobrevibacter sp. TaxID=253161 RepID=UPI00263242AF|nr:molybdate ABC transporter substrate-binding protein [uncultured Methanobrevibacter sp.]
MKSMKKILLVAAIALIAIVCASSAVSAGWFDFLGGSGNSTDTSLDGKEVNLAAAASLKNVYDEKLIPMFQEKYQGAKVTPTYASSGDLQTQIENGLETDVFMSASNKQMNALVNESLIDNNTNLQFLENKVVLIVPANSSSNISSFDDLANASGVIAIGDPESVPAGQYAKEALTNLGIWDSVESKLSLGTDVTAVLNQVAQGSADCGIVYSTDAKSMPDDVKVVCEAPEGSLNTSVIYPVAMIKDAKDADAAQAFLDFLQTKEAKDVFVEYGFTIHE